MLEWTVLGLIQHTPVFLCVNRGPSLIGEGNGSLTVALDETALTEIHTICSQRGEGVSDLCTEAYWLCIGVWSSEVLMTIT